MIETASFCAELDAVDLDEVVEFDVDEVKKDLGTEKNKSLKILKNIIKKE